MAGGRNMKKEACMAAITVCSNNQSLNFQADNKSHILVRACGAMLSVFLTSVIQVENEHPIIFLPVAEALVTCIGVIVLSLFATTPKMPVMEPDLLKNGNQWPHAELIRDIHQQSVVLGRR